MALNQILQPFHAAAADAALKQVESPGGRDRVLALTIDARCLGDTGEALAMVHMDQTSVMMLGCKQMAIPTVMLHLLISAVIRHPELAYREDDTNQNTNSSNNNDLVEGEDPDDGDDTMSMEAPPAKKQKKQPKKEKIALEQTFLARNGTTYPRVDMLRETIKDEEGVIRAYRFIYILMDDNFDLDLGIANLLIANAVAAKKKKKPTTAAQGSEMEQKLALMTTKAQYLTMVENYTGKTFSNDASGLPLHHHKNPASLMTVLRWANTMEPEDYDGDEDDRSPKYLGAPGYYMDEEYWQDNHTLQFYDTSMRIHWRMQDPNVQFYMRLYDTMTSDEWKDGMPLAHQQYIIREAIDFARLNALDRKNKQITKLPILIEESYEHNMEELALCKTLQECAATRNSAKFTQRFKTLTLPTSASRMSDAHVAIFKWKSEQCRTANRSGTKWSIMKEQPRIMDPEMDIFANMMARYMQGAESFMGIMYMHEELILGLCACYSVFEYKHGLKLNIILAGPPTVGKSYVMEQIADHLIPGGSYKEVARSTKCAYDVNMDVDGMMEFRDEAPDWYFHDKKGDATDEGKEKLKLSKGIMTINTMKFDEETNERVFVECTAHVQIGTIMNTNECLNKLAPPMRARFFTKTVPAFSDRPHHTVADFLMWEQHRNPKYKARADAFRLELRTMQYLHMLVRLKIYLGEMVPPRFDRGLDVRLPVPEKVQAARHQDGPEGFSQA